MAKRGHQFRITVATVAGDDGEAPDAAALTFLHVNHDDILRIVRQVRASSDLDEDTCAAVALGAKLLGSAMLAQKNHPLFEPLRDSLPAFVRKLKSISA